MTDAPDPDLVSMLRLLADLPEGDRRLVIAELGPMAAARIGPLLDELSQDDYSTDLGRVLERIRADEVPDGLASATVSALRALDSGAERPRLSPARAMTASPASRPLRFFRNLANGSQG